jgi:hypothetical protein
LISFSRTRSLANIDGRHAEARQARALAAAIASDLGGADTLSALQLGLIERVAVLGVYLAQCEAQWLASGGTGELPADYGSLL